MVICALVNAHARHRKALKYHQAFDLFGHDIQREYGIPQVIKNAHEENEIKNVLHPGEVIDLHLTEFDCAFEFELPCSPAGLLKVVGIDVDPQHFCPAAR